MPTLFDINHKTVFITGGAGILGQHFCEAFLAQGANVVCFDRVEPENLLHPQCLFYEGDVSSDTDVKQACDAACDRFGNIDVLINNAATKTDNIKGFFEPFESYSPELWRDVMSVNLDGMFLVAKYIGQHMVENKQGSIIQTASIYGAMGADQRIYEGSEYLGVEINNPAVYSASKAGVIGLTRHLATLWAKAGVRVNAISPGGVSSGQNTVFSEKYANRVPMGRMATPEDIVGPVLFLASDASKYMTGQNLMVDGGLSAW